ncbi:MAG: DUF1501 domain-containing protein [Candidatus Sumerlaeota bacterium]|nr:DUF1501 domain-containing protein [Candidatus Sumerlaeota bacterium]
MSEQRSENDWTRRNALRLGLLGAAGLALGEPLGVWAQNANKPGGTWRKSAKPEDKPQKNEAKPSRAPEQSERSKSVIQIWMWGGPCHLDTFDPKPNAGYDYCGPYNKPIPTNVNGIQICQMLPLLAQQADKYSIIRSMTHGSNSHETAAYITQTGHQPGERLVYPCIGAVVSLFKGVDHGYKGLLPPYTVLTTLQGRFSEAGFMGAKYKPFATGGDPNQKRFAVEGISTEGISDQRQQERRGLLHQLDTLGKAMPANAQFELYNQCEKEADQTVAETGKVFDLSQEKDELRDRYGRTKFGQSCLMARKLVENGVRYVTINYNGWDTHKKHFESMTRMLPDMDKGMATLLQDLSERGLLENTIVWWSGEFGRTPKIQWEAPWNGGRSHYGKCFCAVLAGGGFKGGRVIGASDARGEEPAERPVYPQDLLGSMYQLMGIDPDGPLPNSKGLDLKVMPSTETASGKGRLKEIMA